MFSSILKDLRKQKRVTQIQLAKDLGVSKSTIAMYEMGQRMPPPDMLLAIADYFGTDVNTLLGVISVNQSITYSKDSRPSLGEDDKEREQFEELFTLFSAVPEADRPLVLGMIRAALSSKGLL